MKLKMEGLKDKSFTGHHTDTKVMYDTLYMRSLLIALGITEPQFKEYIKQNKTGRGDVSIVFWIHQYVLESARSYIKAVTEDAFDLDGIWATKEMDDPYAGCIQEAYMILTVNMPFPAYISKAKTYKTDFPILNYLQQCLWRHIVTHKKTNKK